MGVKLTSLLENVNKREYYKTLFEKNPEFFRSEQTIGIAIELGLFDFVLDIDPDELNRYIDGDWTIRRYTNKEGREVKIGFFETVLSGDTWDLWDPSSYDGDWEGALDYHVDSDNENRIRDIINKLIIKNGNDLEDYTDHSLQDLINEFDEDGNIVSALRSALGDSESSSYHNHLYDELKNACEELGEVIQMNDEGVKIKIDFTKILKDYFTGLPEDPEEFLEFIEDFEVNDSSAIFYELMYDGYGEKPTLRLDDRWYPDVDDKEYNEVLSDRLYDAESDYGLL